MWSDKLFQLLDKPASFLFTAPLLRHLTVRQWRIVPTLLVSSLKVKKTKLVLYILNYAKGNTSRFGSAIQVLPRHGIKIIFKLYIIGLVVVVVFIIYFSFFIIFRNHFCFAWIVKLMYDFLLACSPVVLYFFKEILVSENTSYWLACLLAYLLKILLLLS